jgi:hypothetical protein
MTFGAFILVASDGGFKPLEKDLANSITEIRVEQHLDDQTTFAIRFQEDFTDGTTQTAGNEQIARHKEIAIVAPTRPESQDLVCLVRGQIEQTDFDIATGGPGSWFEVRGRDVRTLIARQVTTRELAGTSDEVMKELALALGATKINVPTGAFTYAAEGEMFRYRGSPLEGIEELALRSNLHFWIEYAVNLPHFPDTTWTIDSTINLMPSPPREQDPKTGAEVPLDKLSVVPDGIPRLVILSATENETVVNFRVSIDFETVTSASAAGLDREGEETEIPATENPDTTVNEDGRPATDGHEITPAYSGQYNLEAAEVAVTEGSWYVNAETLTSAHMLGTVLQPHQLVRVVGAGCDAGGIYHVREVTHVINPIEHWMQVELRTNSLPKEPGNVQA